MNSVLIAGLARGVAASLEQRLQGIDVHEAETCGQVLESLASRTCQLLIIDHDIPGEGAAEVVRRLTEGAESAHVPVLYCMPGGARGSSEKAGIERLGVQSFLTHPFTPHELVDRIAALLQVGEAPGLGETSAPASVVNPPHFQYTSDSPSPVMAEVMAPVDSQRFNQALASRLDVLDRLAVASIENAPEGALFARARIEASDLSGLLSSSGQHDAARLARDIELLLDAKSGAAIDTLRLSECVVELRTELDRPTVTAEPAAPGDARPFMLVLDGDGAMADSLSLEAQTRGLQFRSAADVDEVRTAFERDRPAVVLVDLDSAPHSDDWLAVIGELVDRAPLTPVLVATSAASLANRIAVARTGGHTLLRKPISPASALDAAIGAIRRTHVAGCRVLAVDDDAATLADLKERLGQLEVDLATLHDARRFWAAIEEVRPDVVLLGMNTRHHSGLELCRVLRGDERWTDTPVVILGEASDPAAMHLAALAGADDFIPKPIFARDLVTRIANRLERHRVTQELAAVDPLTGLATRQRGEAALQSLLRLAVRDRRPLSVAAINVDSLRDVNEACGHAAGDAVLRRLGRLLRNSFRAEDVVTRWGGDQLLFAAYGLEKDACVDRMRLVSERLRRDPFSGGEAGIQVSFSAGVSALFSDGVDVPALRHAAEDTLAYAKSLGRGRVLPSGWSPERQSQTESTDVVLVEGDDALAELLLHSLEQVGWSARRFRDADEVTAQLCGPYPLLRTRAVLLEVDLPGKDGFSVLRALSRDGVLGRTRVIMLTARANEREVKKSFEMGAFDHVAKPFSVQVLIQRIRRAIQL